VAREKAERVQMLIAQGRHAQSRLYAASLVPGEHLGVAGGILIVLEVHPTV
jgi:hypothetical protein